MEPEPVRDAARVYKTKNDWQILDRIMDHKQNSKDSANPLLLVLSKDRKINWCAYRSLSENFIAVARTEYFEKLPGGKGREEYEKWLNGGVSLQKEKGVQTEESEKEEKGVQTEN